MNIVIVGGGLGGLTLARVLLVNGIVSTVYEAENSPNERSQGGLLDIHDYNGQLALKDAGLYEKFLELILPGADSGRVVDMNGNILHEDLDRGNGTRPEVHRGELRRILIESLPGDQIKWGHKVSFVSSLGNGKHEVKFTNGTTVISDLLVGSDGAWSKVRALVTDVKPSYVGTSFIEMYMFNSEVKHRPTAKIVGPGTMMAVAPGKGLLTHKESDGTIHTYVAFNKPEDWIAKIDLKGIAEEFKDWAPELRAIVTDTETAPVIRGIYALPVGHKWDRVAGVTLVGDAAHLMSPFAGEGANLAMFDGAELGKCIAGNLNNIEEALSAYEKEMFPRSEISAEESDKNSKLFFNENSPQSVVDLFTSFKTEL